MNWKALAASIGMMLLSYLVGAFVAADFNISNWTHFGRYTVAVLGVGAGIIGAILVVAYEEGKK